MRERKQERGKNEKKNKCQNYDVTQINKLTI